MLYISTSFTQGKIERHLVCFQAKPGTFYLMDDLVGVGANHKDTAAFEAWLKEKSAVEALILVGSAESYTVAVPNTALPAKAIDSINKLIKSLVTSPSDCFYFAPLLTKDIVTGMARHYVRASLGDGATEEQISKATSEQVSSFGTANKKAFLNQRLKQLKAN